MIKLANEPRAPWLPYYGDVPFHIDYPDYSMSEAVYASFRRTPDEVALRYMGENTTYRKLTSMIDTAAKAFASLGVKEGERVCVCMPNVPQTVMCLYAINRIGAVAVMIHPLSAVGEIVNYIRDTGASVVVTLDQFYSKIEDVQKQVSIRKLLITSAVDELAAIKRVAYKLTSGKKDTEAMRRDGIADNVILWKNFLAAGRAFSGSYIVPKYANDEAVVLFSGGTTGVTKGIQLTNLNFNSLALQTITMCHKEVAGTAMLAAMPMFHGFGLGVCVHTMMVAGGRSILVPRFNVKSYSELIKKEHPNYIAGVPTLYEAITRSNYLDGVDLSSLRGVFSGGDSLSIELKKKLDKFLDEHNSPVHVREGYGTTECVTASCLTPYNEEREGSIGFPYPDTYFSIFEPSTDREMPLGEEGEICICGPSVMKGYLNHPGETADTLRVHSDGNTWLHTGDLGIMDDHGFIYFRQRMKRMIITSGYNVYPSQIENVIDAHEAVQMSCVIGVRDKYKMQKVKAFAVLKPGREDSPELRESILAHCRKYVAKYAMPYEIEIRTELPKTLVGKIAYTVLEKEEEDKLSGVAGRESIKLVQPRKWHEDDALAFAQECMKSDGIVHGDASLSSLGSYSNWLDRLDRMSNAATVPDGLVPSKTFFAVRDSDKKIVGIVDIRLKLNDELLNRGGHIGYSVRTGERRKGYGSEMLRLALDECRASGLDKVLIVCDSDNTASEKLILKNGGVLEDERRDGQNSWKRYWIIL